MITKTTGKKVFLTAAAITLLGGLTSMTTVTPEETSNDKSKMEKCYCVAKAGGNDCATPGNGCAGTSVQDGDCNTWIYVIKGTCNRIVNGKTEKEIEAERGY